LVEHGFGSVGSLPFPIYRSGSGQMSSNPSANLLQRYCVASRSSCFR
jgi:hypothetical protein